MKNIFKDLTSKIKEINKIAKKKKKKLFFLLVIQEKKSKTLFI